MSTAIAEARRELREHVLWEIQQKEYRPTAVVFIYNEAGKLLVVRSTINGNSGVVQGGIHKGEDPQAGALREMRQEVGIYFREHVKTIQGPFLVRRMDTPFRRGYKRGKIYWCFRVDVKGTPKIVLQKKELNGSSWYEPNAARLFVFLRAQPWYKKEFLLEAMRLASSLQ